MSAHAMTAIALTLDARGDATPLVHHWSQVVGAGRANEGLRADWQEHLATAKAECGFASVRFHGLLHDDMFVYREGEDGQPIYYFLYVDAVVDRMLEMGVRPFVELGFSPRDLAREKSTVFWWGGHGSPPADLDRWCELVDHLVRHWIERYGIDEVRSWWFEVWNEPNLRPFFAGTRGEYFALYAATARLLKRIDPGLRVGGPSTSNFVADARFAGEVEDVSQHVVAGPEVLDTLDWRPVWVERFLDWCAEQDVPVDFVSCHPYPTDWALDEHGKGAKLTRDVDATPRDVALLRQIVDKSPFPDAAIHLTEWNSSSSPRDHTHDSLPAAAYVARTMLATIGQVDSVAYWTFTDVFEENGAGEELFHGGFGMITVPGVVKPTFHAFRMLNELGDELIGSADGVWATRDSASGAVRVLAVHYPDEVTRSVPASFDGRAVSDATAATGSPRPLKLEIAGLSPGAHVEIEVLDAEHGDALTAWRAMGEPAAPTREQLAELRERGRATEISTATADPDGLLRVERELAPWSIVAVRTL